jgi:predicted transposase YbfD/YdcC
VLALLDLDGALVTADALHCRPDTAQAIRDRKGHYLLAIKSNRGRLFTAVKALCDTARRPSRANQPETTAHGRSERRQAIVLAAPRLARDYDFPGIAAVGRIDSWRAETGKPAKHTVRYFLASRRQSARKLLTVVRAHWGIENRLHWVLDVVFSEDAARSRKGHAPENLAVIRKLAVNILQATPGPHRISHKMLQARWNNDFLLSAIAHMR